MRLQDGWWFEDQNGVRGLKLGQNGYIRRNIKCFESHEFLVLIKAKHQIEKKEIWTCRTQSYQEIS